MKNIIKIVLLIICAYQLNAGEIKLFKSIEVYGSNPSASDMFAWQVAVGEDYVYLSSPNDSSVNKSSGAVYVYRKDGDSLYFHQKIFLENSKKFAGFGNRISHFGDYLVVTTINKFQTKFGLGYIHLFKNNIDKFELISTIEADTTDYSPNAIDFDGNYLAVGLAYSSNYARNGMVKIYEFQNNSFKLSQVIQEDNIKTLHHIGHNLVLKNGILAFSSITADGINESTGAVFVYKQKDNQFEFLEKITPNDGSANDYFGISLALDKDILAIGSMRHSPDKINPIKSGAVYLYSFEGDKFYFFNKIYPKENVNQYDYFGASLDIHNGVLVIGAHSDDEGGKNAGAVYVYNQKGNAWVISDKIFKENSNSHNLFGTSVSILDGKFLCSSHLEELDGNSIDHGVAYYYNNNSSTDVSDNAENEIINLYPNPTKDFVNLTLPNEINPDNISVMDIGGKEVQKIDIRSYKLNNNFKEYSINLKGYPSAVYLILVSDKNKNYSFKVVKV